jgi:uncharacterized membrane protein HdeD (DUF308 family)
MNVFYELFEGLIKAIISGNKKLRYAGIIAIILGIIAIVVIILQQNDVIVNNSKYVALTLAITSFVMTSAVAAYYDTIQIKKQYAKIEDLEKEVRKNPRETSTAWELAQLKLESYLNKNLKQVSSIFYLAATVMFIGFCLIIFGVYKVFSNPELINPAILVTVSGIIVNFIGGTFLIIYKSTMKQAKEYVDVLERINAVGMSIQILENIGDTQSELKDNTTAEIAKELLKIYSNKI